MKVAFLVVVYPEVEGYLADFFSSLRAQTYKEFDVFIFNDGIIGLENKIRLICEDLVIIIDDVYCSPVKIREIGINKILNTKMYDAIVFGDADDYFSENRIEKSVECLAEFDIVVNDLDLVMHDRQAISSRYLSNRLQRDQSIIYDFVKDKNVFGLSNTGVLTSKLNLVDFPEELVALDWYLFSCLLYSGCTARFCSDATTFYRQHKNNTVGMSYYDRKSLYREIEVKASHYKALSEIDNSCKDRYERHLELKEAINSNAVNLELLFQKVTEEPIICPLWWERQCLQEIK